MSLIVPLQNKLVKCIIYIITGMLIHSVGASLVCPVLAGPPFRQFNKIHYIKNYARASRVPITARPFQKSFLQFTPCMLFKECSSPFSLRHCDKWDLCFPLAEYFRSFYGDLNSISITWIQNSIIYKSVFAYENIQSDKKIHLYYIQLPLTRATTCWLTTTQGFMAFTKRTSGVVVIPHRDQPRAVCQSIKPFVCEQPLLYEKVYHNVTIPITPQVERKRIKKL